MVSTHYKEERLQDEISYLNEDLIRQIFNVEQLKYTLSNYRPSTVLSLPLISSEWKLWPALIELCHDRAFTLECFFYHDEIQENFSLIERLMSKSHRIIILIHNRFLGSQLDLFSKLKVQDKKNLSYVLLINKGWAYEEYFKSMPSFIREHISFNFDNSKKSLRLSSLETVQLCQRLAVYLDSSSVIILSRIFQQAESSSIRYHNANQVHALKRSAWPSFFEVYKVIFAQFRSIRSLLLKNPLLFIVSFSLSIYQILRLRFEPISQLIFTIYPNLIFKVYPLRILGALRKYMGTLKRYIGALEKGWWDYGHPIRKVYYIIHFHFINRKKIPFKILLFLKGKKQLW